MQGKDVNLYGTDGIRLTRCGYTGEDGFELSVPSDQGNELTPMLSEELRETSLKMAQFQPNLLFE